ncbi:hypothetical protein HMPREF0454_02436 [Hafnia alvei ATCC 51873]|uniref:Uncharacterized protein n=1 Tax=Hafnia alvei ATCC 51873 TaxID=1002364 RepID=G9Y763_HAFAL|nr:hypothetical protein HMPREF0454_02436 [Hafnia alvei ATCC 51873]
MGEKVTLVLAHNALSIIQVVERHVLLWAEESEDANKKRHQGGAVVIGSEN